MNKDIILKAEDLYFSYDDENSHSLNGLSLEIKRGQKVAFMGSNGSGKSTFFLCCNGIHRPSSGTLYFNGEPVTYDKKGLLKLRSKVGIDPNELGLLEGMAASATIISKEKENVLILSNKAITLKDGKQYVNLRIEDKNSKENEPGAYTLKEVEITTGFSDGRVTEVLSGLSENDVVIVKE